jgi:hypothetical protein
MPEDCSTKGFPQGLKANLFNDLIGTTEVVPCYKAYSKASRIGISHFGLLFKCDCPGRLGALDWTSLQRVLK